MIKMIVQVREELLRRAPKHVAQDPFGRRRSPDPAALSTFENVRKPQHHRTDAALKVRGLDGGFVEVRGVASSYFLRGGCAGRNSMRLARVLWGNLYRSTTALAMSSPVSFHPASPERGLLTGAAAKSVSTLPGMM